MSDNSLVDQLQNLDGRIIDFQDKMVFIEASKPEAKISHLEALYELITEASTINTHLAIIRFRLNRTYSQSGAYQLNAEKRAVNAELGELITNIRSYIYSLTERNKIVMELIDHKKREERLRDADATTEIS